MDRPTGYSGQRRRHSGPSRAPTAGPDTKTGTEITPSGSGVKRSEGACTYLAGKALVYDGLHGSSPITCAASAPASGVRSSNSRLKDKAHTSAKLPAGTGQRGGSRFPMEDRRQSPPLGSAPGDRLRGGVQILLRHEQGLAGD